MNNARRHRFNLIDAVILLAVLAAGAALVYSFVSGIGAASDRTNIRYVLEVPLIQTDFCEKVAADDGVYSYTTTEQIGTVTAVSSAKAYHNGTDSDGAQVASEIQGYSVLYITVEATAVPGDTGYTVGGETISVGRNTKLRFPGLYCTAECISIEAVS